MKWILGSPKSDLAFLYIPTLLCFALSYGWPALAAESLLYALIATVVIDSGHVYTTLWRTYFHSSEVKSDPLVYFLTPALIIICFFLWSYLQFPGLWMFVIYATLFHHIRQNYGILKWYEKLNQRASRGSTYFLWAFSLLPILAYHFREGVVSGYYTRLDLLIWPNETAFNTLFFIWAAVIVLWLAREAYFYANGRREANRIIFLIFIILLYGVCFFIGKRSYEVLFPLLVAHGVTYFALMSHALSRTQKQRFRSFASALLIILGSSIIFGFSENWVEENLVRFDYQNEFNIFSAAIVAFYLTPLFTHFALDAYIWKKQHREALSIYN